MSPLPSGASLIPSSNGRRRTLCESSLGVARIPHCQPSYNAEQTVQRPSHPMFRVWAGLHKYGNYDSSHIGADEKLQVNRLQPDIDCLPRSTSVDPSLKRKSHASSHLRFRRCGSHHELRCCGGPNFTRAAADPAQTVPRGQIPSHHRCGDARWPDQSGKPARGAWRASKRHAGGQATAVDSARCAVMRSPSAKGIWRVALRERQVRRLGTLLLASKLRVGSEAPSSRRGEEHHRH
jgi:hypothetical protein